MLDITFITSNITKLAHAKHLSSKYDVNILHYKKKYYGVGYIEPRILDEIRLLEESMEDAIKRWKKNVSINDTQLFFIEDTSVKIDALSNGEYDYPGADIKYWMLEHDFNSIDNELIKRGNNRKTSVTSHIVLFLTKDIKEREMKNNEYIMFKSTSYGKIVDKECLIKTQILYPWLDNKTFNKWFVPDGFDVPISLLNISDADKADFRRGAFREMYDFLSKYYNIKQITNKSKLINNNIYFSFAPLYIISGPTCAGKSTIGKYLLETHDYYHIEASDFMSLRYFETHGTKFIIDKNNFAAELLKVNPLVVVKNALKYIQIKNVYNRFIVTGFRTADEITNFCKMFPNQDIRIIYITADFNIRFSRWVKRNRDATEYTKERFIKINDLQDKMGLSKIIKIKNIEIFENNEEGFNILYDNFNKRFEKEEIIKGKTNDVPDQIKEISLEKAILIALAVEYRKDENKYYTTTEISHLINEKFKKINKNKNNVSRYFNQSYYPYYEIKIDKNKRKYKLSPTGYSEANFFINCQVITMPTQSGDTKYS
jgi:dephospho-CoA kinase/inosine/xanthosine triphosphate pyrophosphatase family protein